MENSEALAEEAATPGQQLREARERAGISPREMADRLNWSPGHVSAIEEDRYESLRNTAFVRGYLRAYARELDLDGDALVRSFYNLTGSVDDREQSAVLPNSPVSSQKTGLSVVMGMVFALLVIAVIWWQSGEEQPPRAVTAPAAGEKPGQSASSVAGSPALRGDVPATASEGAVTESAGIAGAAATNQSSALDPKASPLEEAAAGAEEGSAGESTAESAAALETALEAGGSAPPEVPAVDGEPAEALDDDPGPEPVGDAPATEVAASILVFDFSDDCWLEVRDADGELIFADLKRAGETVRIDGSPPFDVLAGNTAAVSLRFRGEPFPVLNRPGRDSARFTVGDP